jgi:hypothetical protein
VLSLIWSTHSLRVKLPSPQLIFHRSETHITTKDISAQNELDIPKSHGHPNPPFPLPHFRTHLLPSLLSTQCHGHQGITLEPTFPLLPSSAQSTLANNYSLNAQCSFLSPPQTKNHLPTTTKVSGQDWRQQMPILCSRMWSSTGTPILSPESGLCSLPGAASKFPILLSIQPTYFTYYHSS